MRQIVTNVIEGSIADQLGIRIGDALLAMNGKAVTDWIDYQAFSAEEAMTLTFAREEEETEYTFEKDACEPLGLEFEGGMLAPMRNCANHCVFCFVDQLPENARPSLRVKDDDWRLSLLMGNFVTLTNVSDAELDRIIERRVAPLYVSIHATDPELRARMLGCPRGAKIMSQLNRLARAELCFHAQVVVCPEWNDGEALRRTVTDLAALYPHCLSLALVPVGLTGHRDGLTPLRKLTKSDARTILDAVGAWQARFRKKLGTNFVFAADEMYLTAERALPPDEDYEDYPQIENGVGMLRMLETEFVEAYEAADLSVARPGRLIMAMGVSAAPFFKGLVRRYPVPGVEITVVPIENHFFGPSVTVSGLLTGGDLLAALADVPGDAILVTECMLREGEDVFLDDRTRASVEETLRRPLIKVGRRGEDLLNAIIGQSEDEHG